MAEPHPIVRELDALRRTHGLTLDQLAEKSGVSKTTLSESANGRHTPRIDTATAIAHALDTELVLVPASGDLAKLARWKDRLRATTSLDGFRVELDAIGREIGDDRG